ncbi:MAG: efflux transporter periplasmic adaptor subunit [Crocinitomicaceae bacterium]|nr:efflux transporter periplasmic adaptor subunit [Crocinitomicaceae bacterium]|tara:strand:+ start:5680 stop:7452 length:1773 start_codon:yes stop_codon:yes gene_type:complete
MKSINKKTIYTALGTLVLGLFLGWLIFGGSSNEQVAENKHEHSENTIWTCSMHPQIRQNEPGQCPLCGMDLIPLSDGSSDDNPMEIKMSPTAMQLANVQTSIIYKKKPVKEVRMNGKIKADERNVTSQSSHIPGRIEKLMVSFTGESVQKGQVLAHVYSPELVTAQEELFEAQKIKEAQPRLYQAAVEKLKNWKLTEKQINQILKGGVVQEQFPILADVSGIVLNKKVNLGDYIKKGQTIYEVANLNKVWVLFDVYESDIPWVKNRDKVQFTVQSIPGEIFNGKISFIDPVINPKTRVASARVEISNPGMRLKPDMFVLGTIESPIHNEQEALIVPKTAVMWTGERSVVYTKITNTKGISFMMKEVTLGPALGDSYVVLSGLESGEEIATNGTFSIDAAAQLAGKPSMMNPEGGVVMTGHNHGGGNTPQNTDHSAHSKSISIGPKAKEELKPLLNTYLKLKDALVDDNVENAIAASKEMNIVLSKVNMGVFKGEAHNVWMKHSNSLEKELRKASNTNEIGKMRALFKNMSDQMVMLFKTFGAVDRPVFVNYCPMANNDQGAEWLSIEKEIKNPYFGASMLKCGEVKQEIK